MQHALLPAYSPLENTLHKAGVIRDGLMAASRTVIDMAAECCCAATLDGSQHAEPLNTQP